MGGGGGGGVLYCNKGGALYLEYLPTEFQRLVYDLVKQAVEGTLESEDVATFFTELSSTLVSVCLCI